MKQIKKEDLISFLLSKYPTKEEVPVEPVVSPKTTNVLSSMIERYQPEEHHMQHEKKNGKMMMWIGIAVLLLLIFLFIRRKRN